MCRPGLGVARKELKQVHGMEWGLVGDLLHRKLSQRAVPHDLSFRVSVPLHTFTSPCHGRVHSRFTYHLFYSHKDLRGIAGYYPVPPGNGTDKGIQWDA